MKTSKRPFAGAGTGHGRAFAIAAATGLVALAGLAGCGGGGDEPGSLTGAGGTYTAGGAHTLGDAPAAGGAHSAGGPHSAGGAHKVAGHAAAFDAARESDYAPGDRPGFLAVSFAAAEEQDPSAVPVDRGARTQRGRYISRANAERVDRESGGAVIWIDAACCVGHDPDLPVHIVHGMQAVLGEDARLFVNGSDLRQAARLADRFDQLGVSRHVALVTP